MKKEEFEKKKEELALKNAQKGIEQKQEPMNFQ